MQNLPSVYDPATTEKKIYDFWEKNDCFKADAFSENDFVKIFGNYINWPKLNKLLKKDPSFSNYRGRLFTTSAVIIPPKTPPRRG